MGWHRLGLSNTFLELLYSCVRVWVLHDWKTENNYCEHTWRTNFGHKIIIGRLGWPRLVLSTTLLELLYSGVCGCEAHEIPNESIIGDTHGEQIPETNRHDGVWMAAVGLKQPLQR